MSRLEQLRADDALTTAHVELVADSLSVTPRTVWRWLAGQGTGPARPLRDRFRLSGADREAYAYYRGNVSAIARAREAVLDGTMATAGAPVPEFLVDGWTGEQDVNRRTLARAYCAEMTLAERGALRLGKNARRAASVYLRRPDSPRGEVWEMDHKQLPLLVLPPRGKPLAPWLTTVVDDGTRALVEWALAIYPSAATVLTAMRMALVHDPDRSPFGAVPAKVRIDRGLEFAAGSITTALGAQCVTVHRLPAFTPHRKGQGGAAEPDD